VRIAVSVWWAQFWRYCLALAVLGIAGFAILLAVTALLGSIPGVTLTIAYILWAWISPIPFSIWATRESLVNNYKSFDLKITPASVVTSSVLPSEHQRGRMSSVIEGHKHFADWEQYKLDCPEGTWTARLDHKAWGEKSQNLILYVTDAATGAKCSLLVFSLYDYRPPDKSHDFRNDAEPGDLFEFTTNKTKSGYPNLKSARKVTEQPA